MDSDVEQMGVKSANVSQQWNPFAHHFPVTNIVKMVLKRMQGGVRFVSVKQEAKRLSIVNQCDVANTVSMGGPRMLMDVIFVSVRKQDSDFALK
jgi:hypothetical protein